MSDTERQAAPRPHAEDAPTETPPRIVEADGTVHEGWFRRPFVDANLADAPIAYPLAGLRGTPLAGLERRLRGLRLKEWHYTSIVTPRVLFACAVVDLGYVGNAFAYVVERDSGRKLEWNALSPLGRAVRIAPNSTDGLTSFEAPGFGRVMLDNDAVNGLRRIDVSLRETRRSPALSACYELQDLGTSPDPVVVVERVAPGRWLYTHKCYGLPAGGDLRCGTLADTVLMGEALGGLDWNRGYRARETHWNWAAAAGRSDGGKVIAWNLTAHRPWPGAGASAAPVAPGDADAADSALWLGGRLVKIRRVEFDYDPQNRMAPWRIRDDRGLVDLVFTPRGERSDDTNFGVVVSRFHQPYGSFAGSVCSPEGERFAVGDVYGVTEQHFARW
ncbi:MAG: DUF2804 domain-containing protein [Myxococcales bacterium]|nr:DUF2804 domain-containing protein [Myxococcales bacterium]